MIRMNNTSCLLATVLTLACANSVSAEQTPTVQDVHHPVATDTVASPGMRVFKDPVTGQLREPTAEEVKALNSAVVPGKKGQAKAKALEAAPMRTMMSAGGAVGIEVPESEFNYVVVTRGADGTLHQACANGEDAATHAAHLALKHAAQNPSTQNREPAYETQ